MEEEDLFNELQALPRFALIRRLNDLIKRAKAVKVRKTLNTTYSVPSLNTPPGPQHHCRIPQVANADDREGLEEEGDHQASGQGVY